MSQQLLETKTVEALGYQWMLGANDVAADYGRHRIRSRAGFYLNTIEKTSTRIGAYDLLFGVYEDVLSSAISATPLFSNEGEQHADNAEHTLLIEELINEPAKWVELAGRYCADHKAKEVDLLHEAAKELNPHWYPVEAESEVAEEGSEGADLNQTEKEELEIAYQALDLESPVDTPEPDSEIVMSAASKIVANAEDKAKEAGKIGPKTFLSKPKRVR